MLHIHYSNRLECLFDELHKVQSQTNTPIESSSFANILEPDRILVQSQGMARWLSVQTAKMRGIAANIQYPYPASYLWSVLTQQIHGLPERSSFDKNLLQWRIMKLLPALIEQSEFEPLSHYLKDDLDDSAQGMKAYQLAGKVADIFDQYLVYRPDWVQQWEQNIPPEVQSAWKMAFTESQNQSDHRIHHGHIHNGHIHKNSHSDWQAKLWCELVQAIVLSDSADPIAKEWHRARLVQEFLTLAKAGKLNTDLFPDTLHVFGVSVLPPVYLQLFQVMAQTSDVHLYVMNPSLGYWGDLVTENQLARLRKRWQAKGKTDVSDSYESGNDLLASMGKQGQEYQVLLQELIQDSNAIEHDAFDDEIAGAGDSTLLNLIQSDILQLENRYLQGGKTPLSSDQMNIRVHDCHSPMREVEVLHDQLLHCFETSPDLKPHDIVVMVPDIDRYSPYIQAVFGTRQGGQYIPFSVADRHGRQEHPILEAFFQLLSLAGSDFNLPDVLSILNVKAVQDRFQFEDMAKLTQWITQSNIRWGLNDKQRLDKGVKTSANTWRFGIQRMLMGYLYGELDETLYFGDDPVSPLVSVEGNLANDVGKLALLLEALETIDDLGSKKPIEVWKARVFDVLEQFFVAEGDDEKLLQMIRDVITSLAENMAQAQFDEPIHFSIVQDYLERHVGEISQGQHFLSGQVSFCTLMPMRAIPFKVIALMGLNDSDYPRRQPRLGFDLMATDHRKGDRSRREDDRYLFLEALLSARSHLHISYVGRSIRDNAEKQPSVLVSELLDYASASFCIETQHEQGDDIAHHIVIHHPLQPFNSLYYQSQSQPMQSFNPQWLAATQALDGDKNVSKPETPDLFDVLEESEQSPQSVTEPFIDFYQLHEPKQIEIPDQLSLDELKHFFTHPARTILRQNMGIDLFNQFYHHEKTEAYQLDHLQNYQYVEQAVEQILDDNTKIADENLDAYIDAYLDKLTSQGCLPYSNFATLSQKSLKEEISEFVEPILAEGYTPLDDIELSLALTPNVKELDQHTHIQFTSESSASHQIKLAGWVKNHFDQGHVMWSYSKVSGKALLGCWIDHLAQCAQESCDSKRTHYYARDQKIQFKAVNTSQAKDRLNHLVGLYLLAKRYWLPVFPKAGWAYFSGLIDADPSDEKTIKKAQKQGLDQLLGHQYLNGEFDHWYQYIYRDQPIGVDPLFCDIHNQIFTPLYQHMEQEDGSTGGEK